MENAPPPELFVREQVDGGPAVLPVAGGEAVVLSRRCPGKETPNEDAALVLDLGGGAGLLAVADGCGGLPAGEKAAAAALAALRERLLAPPVEPPAPWSTRVYAAFEAAAAAVGELAGPGTTLSVVLLEDGRARTLHAGDSPILVFGQRGRRRIEVVAHSPTAFAVEAGFLDERQAMVHEDRHLVLNALGGEGARIEIGPPVRLRPRDTVVVASDGLSDNLLPEETIELLRAGPLQRRVEQAAAAAAARMAAEGDGGLGHADDLTLIAWRRRS
ncbi:MAG: hypothetical protein D6702_12785 [Planctomycetota bacterium]|nr:MAG: hypothetical protein D6702_12785 [Planctomycetota bacterium]